MWRFRRIYIQGKPSSRVGTSVSLAKEKDRMGHDHGYTQTNRAMGCITRLDRVQVVADTQRTRGRRRSTDFAQYGIRSYISKRRLEHIFAAGD
jgi:hypothetical protein